MPWTPVAPSANSTFHRPRTTSRVRGADGIPAYSPQMVVNPSARPSIAPVASTTATLSSATRQVVAAETSTGSGRSAKVAARESCTVSPRGTVSSPSASMTRPATVRAADQGSSGVSGTTGSVGQPTSRRATSRGPSVRMRT